MAENYKYLPDVLDIKMKCDKNYDKIKPEFFLKFQI